MFESLGIEQAMELQGDLASGIFGQVTDETLGTFDHGRLEAALTALDADFFNAGAASFDSLPGGTTIFDQLDVDSPDALLDLVAGQDAGAFFGGLFSGNN